MNVTLENIGFGRSAVLIILDLPEAFFANWVGRYGLFSHKQRGGGYHMSFTLSDLMTLGAVKALVDGCGFGPKEACEAIRNYTVYGHFLHNTFEPFVLAKSSEGRWVGMDGADVVATVNLKVVPLYHQVRKGIDRLLKSDDRHFPGPLFRELNRILPAWDEKIEELLTMRRNRLGA